MCHVYTVLAAPYIVRIRLIRTRMQVLREMARERKAMEMDVSDIDGPSEPL